MSLVEADSHLLTPSSATWASLGRPSPLPVLVGGSPRFYFCASVPQMPLLAQRSVAGRGDFGEEALSTSSRL